MPDEQTESGNTVVSAHRHRWRTILKWIAFVVLAVVAVAVAAVWIERKPIARNVIRGELASRGVQGSYKLRKVGLRTQEVTDLSIGDPAHPDLVAKDVLIQTRLKWNGSIDVYRIVAKGVRLRGKVLADGKVSWGQLDKLLPAQEPNAPRKPFTLPDVAVDVADTSISLQTPWGPLGFAVKGSGNLSGGFSGHFVVSSPQLVTAKCAASNVRGAADIEVKARHPHVVGPLTAGYLACPSSRFSVVQPRLDLDSKFTEGFDSFDASARIMSQVITAGDNGLAALNGRISLNGDPTDARGTIDLAAQKSRLGTISADRTHVAGKYRLQIGQGRLTMVGNYSANGASLAPSMTAGLTTALQATRSTPIGPVAAVMGKALQQSARSFDVSGGITLVNFPGGGGARVTDAKVHTSTGGNARISGGKGVTYYWPSGVLRVDGTIQMAGGGLPTGFVTLSQQPNGAMTGVGQFQPYVANGSRLTLSTLRFAAEPSGATRFATVAGLTGNFPGGQVRGLNLPISGRIGAGGGIWVGERCMVVSFDYLKMQQIQLNAARLPVCPTGAAIIAQPPGGALRVAGRIDHPQLSGAIGDSPMRLAANSILLSQSGFNGSAVALRLGKSDSPLVLNAESLSGVFGKAGVSGRVGNADAVIGSVPLKMTKIDGKWQFVKNRLAIDGSLLLSDRQDPVKFYPLKSDDVHFVMADNRISATGTLRNPDSGTKVTDVSIEHDLDTGSGHADLAVPGITFGPDFQPDQLTPLTEGVVALVNGTVTGKGRIDWTGSGTVTSTGEFATRDMDLAAPFGPVTGLTTDIHFTDLLGLETAPHQVATTATINPGIEVDNGIIHYQILPGQLVKIERGEWPFMGGKLILHETILNFGSPSAKRLTFELQGFDAKQFVDTLGIQGLEIDGTFDGVLPMIFDENGGRIVGGRLDSRPPGGELKYSGTKPSGLVAGTVFALVSDLKYRGMTVRLDGDLAGEFATRLTVDRVSLGSGGGLLGGLVRSAFSKVPLQLNVNINGPFRALIEMSKAFKDPTQTIAPVMPFPIDSPALDVQVLDTKKTEDQTDQPPAQSPPPASSQSPSGAQK